MDGYTSENVVQRKLRKLPAKEKKNPYINKVFFDAGDYQPGIRKTMGKFKEGEFRVRCYQPDRNPRYWCERLTNIEEGKREFVEFFCPYVEKRVEIYDKE